MPMPVLSDKSMKIRSVAIFAVFVVAAILVYNPKVRQTQKYRKRDITEVQERKDAGVPQERQKL